MGKVIRFGSLRMAAIGLTLALGACGDGNFFPTSLSSVSQDRTYTGPGEGRWQVGEPYTINGMSFTPQEDYGYSEVGLASWYGRKYHGRQTANGEIYDMYKLTAAHPTLPLPSIVRVTNLENGAQLDLRVNDRGPFIPGRILDVSKAAADRLGFKTAGVTQVRVDILAGESRRLKQAMLNGGGQRFAAAPPPSATLRPAVANTRQISQRPAPGNFITASAGSPTIASAPPPATLPQPGGFRVTPIDPIIPQVDGPPRRQASAAEHAVIDPAFAPKSPAVASRLVATSQIEALPTPAVPAQAGPIATAPSLPPSPGFATETDLPDAWTPLDMPPASVPRQAANQTPQLAALQTRSIGPFTPAFAPPPGRQTGLYVQAGAFGDPGKAARISDQLAAIGPALVAPVNADGRELYRVRIGPFADRDTANRMRAQVAASGFPDALTIANTQ